MLTIIYEIVQLAAYAVVQTFGISIFTLSLQRLGKLKRVYRLKAFWYLLLINLAGGLTFHAESWFHTTIPVVGALFIIGVPFMILTHLYLLFKK